LSVSSDLVPDVLRAVEAFDAPAITRLLQGAYGRLGPLAFLTTVIDPLLRAVGDAWEQRRLNVRHEHFLSERLMDLLRAVRLPFEERATGPLVVLATLPGEAHALGTQMAALVLVTAGCRILSLGTDVPVAQIARVAAERGARAVAVSISAATRGAASGRHLRTLRRLLPRHVSLLAGGEGSPASGRGIEAIGDLAALDVWARRIAAVG
jgi:methanogenic corrinoid protein MtbC1